MADHKLVHKDPSIIIPSLWPIASILKRGFEFDW